VINKIYKTKNQAKWCVIKNPPKPKNPKGQKGKEGKKKET
jgi:hypothetical protein